MSGDNRCNDFGLTKLQFQTLQKSFICIEDEKDSDRVRHFLVRECQKSSSYLSALQAATKDWGQETPVKIWDWNIVQGNHIASQNAPQSDMIHLMKKEEKNSLH